MWRCANDNSEGKRITTTIVISEKTVSSGYVMKFCIIKKFLESIKTNVVNLFIEFTNFITTHIFLKKKFD
jgi:hypothetical protein